MARSTKFNQIVSHNAYNFALRFWSQISNQLSRQTVLYNRLVSERGELSAVLLRARTGRNSRTLFPASQVAVRFTAALSRKLIGHDTDYKQLAIHPLKTS